MSNSTIRVVLHGGLGNQLFQYFVGRLEAQRRSATQLWLLPDLLGRYGTARELELGPLVDGEQAGLIGIDHTTCFERLRLPKIVWRITHKEVILSVPGVGAIIDGYFHREGPYGKYRKEFFLFVLSGWRDTLTAAGILQQQQEECITHVRLGDFFHSDSEARVFARQRLQALTSPTHLATDQERILGEELARLSFPFEVKVIPTSNLSAWNLLSLLTRYRRIQTNGSSLAFWAAVLAHAELNSSNSDHEAIWRLLTRHDSDIVPPMS